MWHDMLVIPIVVVGLHNKFIENEQLLLTFSQQHLVVSSPDIFGFNTMPHITFNFLDNLTQSVVRTILSAIESLILWKDHQ